MFCSNAGTESTWCTANPFEAPLLPDGCWWWWHIRLGRATWRQKSSGRFESFGLWKWGATNGKVFMRNMKATETCGFVVHFLLMLFFPSIFKQSPAWYWPPPPKSPKPQQQQQRQQQQEQSCHISQDVAVVFEVYGRYLKKWPKVIL